MDRFAIGAFRSVCRWLPLAFAGMAGPGSSAQPQPFTISVNVDLVVLHATVEERHGKVALDLRQQDFTIHEDGVKQAIRLFRYEDMPVTAGLIVDHSGSMKGKLRDVVLAARAFIKLSSAEDEMFVVNFNDTVHPGLPAGRRFTNRPEDLARAIANTAAVGRTALYDAVSDGLLRVRTGRRQKRVLVVISDGADNASVRTLDETLRLAAQSNAAVYTIGIFDEEDPDRNPGVLRKLAKATGGQAFFPKEPGELVSIGERIARDIRHQYTLGYLSTGSSAAGIYRSIRVAAAAPGRTKLSVRTRAGYITGGVPPDAAEILR